MTWITWETQDWVTMEVGEVMTTSEYIQLYTSLLNPSNRSAFYFPRPVEPGCTRAS
ncbi:hypothetical protein M378DRAFT_167400 [Amanita muscaria Koide BX008]|uniref:Uncharacterized protein n=1 Tax=Amanita muscaria (strain Koide BX008) TaxID=946122 RepID=A0A0C2WHV8_AMAMK|nr:hypothetical protein M378DRAFT_167400 [Amanita muscaria Koide BX008]